MQRRNFLRLAGLAGAALALPALPRRAQAAAPYGGPFWVLVHAAGAWDPRFHFDPVAPGPQNRRYTQIGSVGAVQFADYPVDAASVGLDATQGYDAWLMSNRAFFEKHAGRFTFLNGVDTATNNHEAGTRATWSGRLLGEYPAFGAIVASARAADQPMPLISGGGYDVTSRLVPLARVGDPSTLSKLAVPLVIDPSAADSPRYHTEETFSRIRAARAARLEALRGASGLPREQRSLDELRAALTASAELARFTPPATPVEIPGYQLDDLERLLRGAQVAVSAFRTGVAAVATLQLGGFDTHGSHDRDQAQRLAKLWRGIDYLVTELETAGLLGNTYIVVASDFGRGPLYNSERDDAGKDHWPVTSMMVSGPNVPGGRVIGATDAGQRAVKIDPGTFAPSDSGVALTPEIVHGALRRVAGVADQAAAFPLAGPELNLFG